MDLATVGRRVVENEADLLELIAPEIEAEDAPLSASHVAGETLAYGPPTLAELLDAVASAIQDELVPVADARSEYLLRVCRTAIAMSMREIELGSSAAAVDAARRSERGIENDDRVLAAQLRAGDVAVDAALLEVLVERTASYSTSCAAACGTDAARHPRRRSLRFPVDRVVPHARQRVDGALHLPFGRHLVAALVEPDVARVLEHRGEC